MMWRTMTAVAASVLLATAATAGPTLTATAGLGGMVRASRWTPVRVLLAATDAATTGDLEVVWGSATIRRRLVFDSPGTRRIDFHIRTPDAEPQLRVRFSPPSGVVVSIEVPVQIARDVDRIEVCVVPEQAEVPDDSICSTRVAPADLPVSLRGYEAADAVLWPVGRVGLAPAQDVALAQWETLKRLDATGSLSLTPQAQRPTVERGLPPSIARGLLLISSIYCIVLWLVGAACARRGLGSLRLSIGVTAAVALACAAMVALGHVGPQRAVIVHHRSVLQQVPGTEAALLSMRAVAQFPGRDVMALRLPVADGVIEPSQAQGQAETSVDAEGFPTLTGTVTLADRRSFGVEAVVPAQLLTLEGNPAGVRITNRSRYSMQGCQLASGLQPATVDVLDPGRTIEAIWEGLVAGQAPDVLGPLVTCSLNGSAVSMTDSRRPVHMRGTTLVAAYQPPARVVESGAP